MDFFKILYDEAVSFFGIGSLIDMFKSGNYTVLLTLDGILSAIGPVMPLLLVIEIARAFLYKKFRIEDYRVPFFIFVFNRVVSRFVSLSVVAYCIGLFEKYGLLKTSFTWYWLIYGYIVWEFGHFIYHYLAHKVRLLWCLHSTHHAPEVMNLSINYAHFFLEAPYADLIRTSVCILAGVTPPMLFLIMFIDGTWGSFIHVGEGILKDGRLGFMENVILTPSHHRVHHARNPLYMDTNFCNLLNIWDRFFRTFQNVREEIAPEYGITRKVNSQSFVDVYFGEFSHLWKDIRNASGITNKLLYLIMPPGWNPDGLDKTARKVRTDYLKNDLAGKKAPDE